MRSSQTGLSPRMRGNHYRQLLPLRRPRSIPAYAGEPQRYNSSPLAFGVYPRVCGGTITRRHRPRLPYGLSPRMRGNQHQ